MSHVDSFEEADDFERTNRGDLSKSGISSVSVTRERPTRTSVSVPDEPVQGVARCIGRGFHDLYPRLFESAMQEVYRESSYYEGGACGYADTSDTAQETLALRATFKHLSRNLAKRGLTGGDLLEIGCGYGYLLDEARSFLDVALGRISRPRVRRSRAPRAPKYLLKALSKFHLKQNLIV